MLTFPMADASGSGRARHPSHYLRPSPSKDGPLMPHSLAAAGIRIGSQRHAPSFHSVLTTASANTRHGTFPSASPSQPPLRATRNRRQRPLMTLVAPDTRRRRAPPRVWPAFFRLLYSAVEDRQKDTRIRIPRSDSPR